MGANQLAYYSNYGPRIDFAGPGGRQLESPFCPDIFGVLAAHAA